MHPGNTRNNVPPDHVPQASELMWENSWVGFRVGIESTSEKKKRERESANHGKEGESLSLEMSYRDPNIWDNTK